MAEGKGHTELPWSFRDVVGAGVEIFAPVHRVSGVELPKGMPNSPIKIFELTAPQSILIAAERWVQFEPNGWHEMQIANANLIVTAVNTYPAVEGLVKALEELSDLHDGDDPVGFARETAKDALSRFRSLQNGGAND